MEGTILFYKEKNKYGFIKEDNKADGDNEMFFHTSGISDQGFKPKKGDRVTYEVVDSDRVIKGKPVKNAVNIKIVDLYGR